MFPPQNHTKKYFQTNYIKKHPSHQRLAINLENNEPVCFYGGGIQRVHFFRLLLCNVPGATSSKNIRTVEGQEYNINQAACHALRLFNNYGEVRYRSSLAEYYLHSEIISQYNKSLEPSQETSGQTTHRQVSRKLIQEQEDLCNKAYILSHPDQPYFNGSQQALYNSIMKAMHGSQLGARLYFVNRPGGTGNIFVCNVLFQKIPINVDMNSMCSIFASSQVAQFLRRTELIVWGEVSMVNKYISSAVNCRIQDTIKAVNPVLVNVPCSGFFFVFEENYQQAPHANPRTSKSQTVAQYITSNPEIRRKLEDPKNFLLRAGNKNKLMAGGPDTVAIPNEISICGTNLNGHTNAIVFF
ncbi:hypothetical protein PHYBLDRAFT_67626 [Phycomyces blakesleeanus NRRL 1555(-)]|uniref:ATP-dependent DNA helicase n=1 Tax=Phycomyces blakesleeanus (strain ATCC 8743b / DSM 1359 / FGSC 10004 / NBRC 33097 / NRRL 1555) TaxID=763407 RepID=A0A162NI06_PHYB8|nr:hypothetical protein PHYBLDRAFT_67626 [Phycomyces blakesleeanus NRRL 1555(-)]OAD74448.1 hypothetical protein PHYBLDRAFT_67626 [Phycomyces blakesleeanus NRRL 1555(-)]|eukprot:XP_018292488.1 hypothetical protein PHYBLDRAFT_67626 [Phycomyces blakesleeanus NRRL 1555(-)]